MKISYNWLKQYVDIDLDPEQLAEKLTLHGLEVDAVEKTGSDFKGVVIGDVLEVKEHPNADRLMLCSVDIGSENVQIVCGAPNVKPGQKVPVATVGTELPVQLENGSPLVIKKAEIRGEKSEGMICAEDELGLGEDHSGIMDLDTPAKAGTPFTQIRPPTQDVIFDIELTPNRPDAACHLGTARDIAAFSNQKINYPEITIPEDAPALDKEIEITIENEEKCNRYVGMLIKDAVIEESPPWLKNRLRAIGVRPVNAVVDATNFVLHEMGQPLHAFDYDLLADQKIVVKDFDEEVTFETLDHVNRKVPAGTLFICDGRQPIAVAGVMGGVNSEINDETTNILLESAYFDPAAIRRASKNLGLQTDASYRFERGIDPDITLKAAYRCAEMIAELTGGKLVDGHTDVHPVRREPVTLSLRISYLNRLLGTSLSAGKAAEILDRLEITVVEKDDKNLKVSVPTFRPDLNREVDLIEEIGRIYDYNNIEMPQSFCVSKLDPVPAEEKIQQQLKDLLKSHGFKEIYTNSLLSEENALLYAPEQDLIHTLNPISQDQAVLRTSLQHGFLHAAAYNIKRGAKQIRFFELGHVFKQSQHGTYFEGYREDIHFSVGLAGYKQTEHWLVDATEFNIFDLKAPIQTCLKQLEIAYSVDTEISDEQELIFKYKQTEIGKISEPGKKIRDSYEIDLPVFYAEFSLSNLLNVDLLSNRSDKSYTPVPKFPTFEFDLALIVDKNVRAGELMKGITRFGGERLHNIRIFDVFEGGSLDRNKKSIAFRLSFLDSSKTLTINEIQPIIDDILKQLNREFGATLRSQ